MKKRLFLFLIAAVLVCAAPFAALAEIVTEVVPLERAGVKLHLACMTNNEFTTTKPILLVHGLTYSSHEFDVNYKDYSLARFLANNGFAVWTLDIAGYGSSQPVEDGFMPDSDYAAEDIAAAATVILEKSGRKSLDLLGWSWGTVTGGRFAAKHPEMVNRLVLYAPIVAGLGDYKVDEAFHKNTWPHAADDFQRTPDGSDYDYSIVEPEIVNTYVSNCWRYDQDSSPNGGRRDLCVAAENRLIPTAQLTVPTLMIAGEKDQYVTPELCKEGFATLTNKESRLVIIPGAAHAMMMEAPYYRIFRENVLDFLWN